MAAINGSANSKGFLNAKSCVYAKKRINHGKKTYIIAIRRSGSSVRIIKESIQDVEEKSEIEKQNIKKLIGVNYIQKT